MKNLNEFLEINNPEVVALCVFNTLGKVDPSQKLSESEKQSLMVTARLATEILQSSLQSAQQSESIKPTEKDKNLHLG